LANVKSFKPIINADSKLLILGSMPGVESLQKQQYYANKRNQFWQIIFSLFDVPLCEKYEEKIEFLKRNRIALWDVIESCYREGSLDSNIKEERVNDFSLLFAMYPNIKYVIFNGGKAYVSFKKYVGFEQYDDMTFIKISSTSPAHTISFDDKKNQWNIIREYLDENKE